MNTNFEQHIKIIERLTNISQYEMQSIYSYGSRVYGTHSENSDYDYIIVSSKAENGQQYDSYDKSISLHMYTPDHWQTMLNEQKIFALECNFLPNHLKICNSNYSYTLDRSALRKEISTKSSNSWVKCKKKLEVENDVYIGLKSLFHSIRIPLFGIQIAKHGKIIDYSEANNYWDEIKNSHEIDWNFFKEKYQPILNSIMTEFRKYAEK